MEAVYFESGHVLVTPEDEQRHFPYGTTASAIRVVPTGQKEDEEPALLTCSDSFSSNGTNLTTMESASMSSMSPSPLSARMTREWLQMGAQQQHPVSERSPSTEKNAANENKGGGGDDVPPQRWVLRRRPNGSSSSSRLRWSFSTISNNNDSNRRQQQFRNDDSDQLMTSSFVTNRSVRAEENKTAHERSGSGVALRQNNIGDEDNIGGHGPRNTKDNSGTTAPAISRRRCNTSNTAYRSDTTRGVYGGAPLLLQQQPSSMMKTGTATRTTTKREGGGGLQNKNSGGATTAATTAAKAAGTATAGADAATSAAAARAKWRTAKDAKTGRTYYYHVETRQSQWRKPVELATREEREEMERKERQQREFFEAMEANILKSISEGAFSSPEPSGHKKKGKRGGGDGEAENAAAVVAEQRSQGTPGSISGSFRDWGGSDDNNDQGVSPASLPFSTGRIPRPNLVRTISTMDEAVLRQLIERVPSHRNVLSYSGASSSSLYYATPHNPTTTATTSLLPSGLLQQQQQATASGSYDDDDDENDGERQSPHDVITQATRDPSDATDSGGGNDDSGVGKIGVRQKSLSSKSGLSATSSSGLVSIREDDMTYTSGASSSTDNEDDDDNKKNNGDNAGSSSSYTDADAAIDALFVGSGAERSVKTEKSLSLAQVTAASSRSLALSDLFPGSNSRTSSAENLVRTRSSDSSLGSNDFDGAGTALPSYLGAFGSERADFGLSEEETGALQKLAAISNEMSQIRDESDSDEDDLRGEGLLADNDEDDRDLSCPGGLGQLQYVQKADNHIGKQIPVAIGSQSTTRTDISNITASSSEKSDVVSPPPKSIPRPTMVSQRRNTCGTLYVNATMSAPDKDATIKVS